MINFKFHKKYAVRKSPLILGFTVVELTAVIGVVAILAAVTITGFGAWQQSAAKRQTQSDVKQAANAMESTKNFGSGYPGSIPSTFKASSGVTVAYSRGDTSTYCLQATSSKFSDIRYYMDPTVSKDPKEGLCPSAPTPPGGSTPPATITNGLAAWWPLNGNANDDSGNNNGGTVYSATATSGQNGSTNSAYAFNGSSSYISSGKSLLNSLTTYSYGGWVYYTTAQTSGAGLAGQNDNVEQMFYNGGDSTFYQNGATTTCPYLAQNQWHFIYITYDGSTTNQYADGSSCGTSASSSHSSSGYNFNIGGGGIKDSSGNFFNGKIDDIRLYNRALSASEIQTLYNNGAM